MKQKLLEQSGMSLLETVVATVLIGIFLGISVALVAKNARWMAETSRQLLWVSEVNHGFRALQKDFSHLQDDEVVFYHPRMIILRKPNHHWVIYYLWRNTLYRNWQPLISNLQSGNVFTLLNVHKRPTTSPRQAQYIEIRFYPVFGGNNQIVERFYVAQ